LVEQLKQFLIEHGRDFCNVGSQYPIQVGGRDFALDLVFFNRALNCLVAFELKVVEFEPEHLGKLQFYLEALDRDVKKPHEQPSIGVLLCATKNNEVVEYALSRSMSPALSRSTRPDCRTRNCFRPSYTSFTLWLSPRLSLTVMPRLCRAPWPSRPLPRNREKSRGGHDYTLPQEAHRSRLPARCDQQGFAVGDTHRVHFVCRLFQREPEFAAASANYDFGERPACGEQKW
jgi:YhcG PDDEXK nuclease domain